MDGGADSTLLTLNLSKETRLNIVLAYLCFYFIEFYAFYMSCKDLNTLIIVMLDNICPHHALRYSLLMHYIETCVQAIVDFLLKRDLFLQSGTLINDL